MRPDMKNFASILTVSFGLIACGNNALVSERSSTSESYSEDSVGLASTDGFVGGYYVLLAAIPTNPQTVTATMISDPHMAGVSLRRTWDIVEPSEGHFDFS